MVVATFYASHVSYRFLVYGQVRDQRKGIFLYVELRKLLAPYDRCMATTQVLLELMTFIFAFSKAGPFHGWFSLQSSADLMDHLVSTLFVASCVAWSLVALLTLVMAGSLCQQCRMREEDCHDKREPCIAYSHVIA